MKQAKKIAAATNFCAADFGVFSELGDYVLPFGPDVKIIGKVFGDNILATNGSSFSFQIFQPGEESGFLHTHKTHEELYFFLRGSGEFQVDGNVFSVAEGSVVRVSPDGERSVRNNGSEPLVMLCVQYRGVPFTPDDAADGIILGKPVTW